MGYSSKEKPSTENDDEPLGLGIHYFQTKPHTLFKPSLPSWWQMCFFDDSQSHVLWWAKRWDDTLTRWFPFLQIHTGLEWKWQWPYWVGNTGHKNNNNYIYICNTHVYSIETNPWDMPHPGKLTRSRGFQSSKRLLVDFHHNSSMITRTVVSQTISMLVWYSAFFSSGTSIQFTLLFFLGAVVSAIQEQHRTTIYHISGYKRK